MILLALLTAASAPHPVNLDCLVSGNELSSRPSHFRNRPISLSVSGVTFSGEGHWGLERATSRRARVLRSGEIEFAGDLQYIEPLDLTGRIGRLDQAEIPVTFSITRFRPLPADPTVEARFSGICTMAPPAGEQGPSS